MTALFRLFPLRVWIALGILAAFAAVWGAMAYQKARADRAVAETRTQRAATKALDQVATQTPIIRADQEEKQRAVDQIQGADQPLPDGFGAELERLRRGQRGDDPR